MSAQEQVSAAFGSLHRWPARRVIVLGTSEEAQRIAGRSRNGCEVVRILRPAGEDNWDYLTAEIVLEALRGERIWGVIVAGGQERRLPPRVLLQCRLNGIRILDEESFWERMERCIDMEGVHPGWLLSIDGFRAGRLRDLGKRIFDIVVAAVLLLITVPLVLLVAVLVKCESSGPVLYRQDRVGLRGRVFILFKFRSMRSDAEPAGIPVWAGERDSRITRIGRFIRYTRIDELPQLWNVLCGDMSIVGPRPERPYYVARLAAAIPLYAERHLVKPGITGWAQINLSYGASPEHGREKLRYDLYYIKNRSLLLDLRILISTVRIVLFQEGAR